MSRKVSWMFLFLIPLVIFGLSWRVNLDITDGTSTRTLTWGLDPEATDNYDFGVDENFPLIPPSGLYAFFPIDDPYNPYVTMLTSDIRQDTIEEHIWKGTVGGTFDPVAMTWDETSIPLGDAFIGVGTFDTEPTEWFDMTTVGELYFNPGDYFWISFTPSHSGDIDNPPFIVSTYPTDGATSVPTTATLQITLGDNETGIDPSSVTLMVDGVDVSSLASISRDGTNWVVSYTPAGGFPASSSVDVYILACDIGVLPNSVEYSFSFSTAGAPSPVLWEVPIVVHNADVSGDTTDFPLSFGAADGASELFDPAYDTPYPGPTPGIFYCYFPLVDTAYEFTMLTRDIRNPDVENVWTIRIGNPGASVWATWNIADIPAGDYDYKISSAFPPSEPTEWYSMTDIDNLTLTVGQWIWIKQTIPVPPDSEPPYLVSSTPTIGATGVPSETNITVVIADNGAGVDISSIVFTVEGEDVTALSTITESDGYVYIVYTPETPFPSSERIDWNVSVSDLAESPNSAFIDGYFTTGFYPTPEWMVDLTLYISPFGDDEYTSTLTFGVDEVGTDHFDLGLDYLYAPPPPGASAFYFYIEDTVWTQLQRDIRSSYADSVLWVAYYTNIDTSSATYRIGWDSSELPSTGTYMFATTDLYSEPAEWFSMRDISEVSIDDNGRFYILYSSELPHYCLSGTVTLEGDGDLSGSIVEISELGIADTTDSDGNYEICDIPAGTYTVLVSHDGYADYTDTVTIVADTNLDVALNLMRYTVSGTVIPEDLPEGSRDSITVVLGMDIAYTDSDGVFEFDDVLAGTYTLHIEYEGYSPLDTIIDVDSDLNLTFYLELLRYTVSGWIELEGLISGNWDSTVVTLGDWTTLTNESGYFEFDDVLPGEYDFGATHDTDYIPFDTTLDVEDNVSLEITLHRVEPLLGNIFVFVSLEGGGSLAGTRVILQETNDTMTTNPSGRARFRNVEYGDYTLEVSRDNYQTVITDVSLYSPAETVYVTLNLKRGVIDGFVYLSDSPLDLSGSSVILDGTDTITTDVTGFFEFSDILYGEHTLHFEHGTDYTSVDTSITLTDPGTAYVEVTLDTVTAPALNPPQNLRVISGYHNRVAIRWDPPEPSTATLLGYGVIRSSLGGIDTIAIVPAWCTSDIDYDGVTGLFSVFAIYSEGNSNSIGPQLGYPGDNAANPDVLILDFDNGALLADNSTSDEALDLQQLLWTGNVTCQITGQDEQLDSYELLYYKAVFIVTGIRDDDNTLLSEYSLYKILDYLSAGGRVFWEGADLAADYDTSLSGYVAWAFGVELASDGRPSGGNGNVSTLFGQSPYFEGEQEFYYDLHSNADQYNDEFYFDTTANAMMLSQDNSPPPISSNVRMVANEIDLSDYGYTSNWLTVASSIYLGGIQYHDENSNRYEVLRAIWYYLFDEELPSGIDEPNTFKVPENIDLTVAPTPFNSSLDISVSSEREQNIHLEIADISGRTVAEIYDGKITAGQTKFRWDASDKTPSGTYFVILDTGNGKVVRKAALIR